VARVLRDALDVNTAELPTEALYAAQAVCRLVVRRSARMAAVLLVATLRLQARHCAPRARRGRAGQGRPGAPGARACARARSRAHTRPPPRPRPPPAGPAPQGWLDAPRRAVVAVDGGVFLKYHNWRVFLDQYVREAVGEALNPKP
jgi:hypothetical protein